jgi:acetate kinase
MASVLVINSGSSSLKYALIDPARTDPLAEGLVERIGESAGRITHSVAGERQVLQEAVADHAAAFAMVHRLLAESAVMDAAGPLTAVGHRVVHGGARFSEPAIVDDEVLAAIESVVPLAPLHNPANLLGIRAAMQAYPEAPHVAVFDTAFHSTMPPEAYTYAIDAGVAEAHQFRRYGFHGTSHRYVTRTTADFLDIAPDRLDMVSLHLGNGASAAAIAGGRSVETSMGVGPLEGLVMGTRSGDVDPTIILTLLQAGMTAAEVDTLLNRASGMKGLCGDNDLRAVQQRAESGDRAADLARRVYVHRIKKYLGAYMAVLGRADAVVFTAGVGENDWWIRQEVCEGLQMAGIAIDRTTNAGLRAQGTIRDITAAGAPVRVLVVPTDEEREIAQQAVDLVT